MKLKTWQRWVVLGAVLAAVVPQTRAEDTTDRLGIGGSAGFAIPVGGSYVRDNGADGAAAGAFMRYGLSPNWGVGLIYDNLSLRHDVRVEALNLAAIYSCSPEKRYTPYLQLGAGIGAGEGNRDFNDFGAKTALGLEYFFTSSISGHLQAAYNLVTETGDANHVAHIITPGLGFTYYFGKNVAGAAAAPPPAPAPVSVVSIALDPTESRLYAGQTAKFNATVNGSTNQGVLWSHAPALGTLLQDGIYTAPSSVAFEETVKVTATSQADGSKVATALVHLMPAADAAKKVSITLNVLFDTAKDIVKPEFHNEIQKVADFMKTYSRTHAEIAGHTDNMGAQAYNVDLSQRRADAVKNELVKTFGIDASRLSAKGYGPNQPIADNGTADGRAKNRRVVADITAAN